LFKQYFLVFISLFLFLSSACKKDRIKIEGVEQLEIPVCESHPLKQYRVEDQSAFNLLLNGFIENDICTVFAVPVLDFDEVSVLGFESFSNSCDNDYSHTVDARPNDSVYEFTVHVRMNVDCTENERLMHWISIPKIPTDYTVEFLQVNN